MQREKTVIGADVIRLETTDSTNIRAIEMLKAGMVPEGTVILADYQSAGKGQQGNIWVGERGKNLTFSVVLYPKTLTAENQFFLSMSVSNAVADSLQKFGIKAFVKWPNDIYTQNGKIGGILIENSLTGQFFRHSVAGIGINVNQISFGPDAGTAVSIFTETGQEYDREAVLQEMLANLSGWINRLYESDHAGIKVEYLNKMLFLNQWRTFICEKEKFEGRITDVTDQGMLLVQDRSGKMKEFYFREIKLQ